MIQLQRLILHPHQLHSAEVSLDPDQARYLIKVLRLKAGEHFIAMDGQGHWWKAQLTHQQSTAAILEPIEINHELPLPLTLGIAPAKGKGVDEVIHSATELGVRDIYPILSERTLVRPSPSKIERWQKIAREATEQSLRQFTPVIHPALPLDKLAQQLVLDQPNAVFFCSTQPGCPPLAQALQHTSKIHQATILTGPEGGWSSAEEGLFNQHHFTGVSLGPRTLRAITAPICALSLAAAYFES